MASALGRKAVYLSHFTPSMMAPETLEAMLVQREPLLTRCLDHVQESLRTGSSHHLAEGNPRIYIIFAQFLSRDALDELVEAFMHTLDELTPYYQARMKELSGQQRKIVEYLVNYRGAAPVRQIAKACFITQQTCSSSSNRSAMSGPSSKAGRATTN